MCPAPRDDEIEKEQHGRQAANTSYDLGIRDLGPHHGRPQLIAHRRRPALRPGCRQPAGRRITKVTFGLWNSFAHTYRGHGTDRALVAGILGLDTDDENIKQAFDLAREQGLSYHFDIKGDDAPSTPTPSTSTWSMTRAPRRRSAARAWRRQDAHQPHQRRRRRYLGHVFHPVCGAPGCPRRSRRAHEPARLRTRKHCLLPHLPNRGRRPSLFRL